MNSALAEQVLDFWFLPATHAEHNHSRVEWFRKDERFDGLIRERFGAAVERTLANSDSEPAGADEMLAQILLLDQFTRNIFRGTPHAFAGDSQALKWSAVMIDSGLDQALPLIRRSFVYLPFEHAEDLAMQDKSIALFATLVDKGGEYFARQLDYANRHREIIVRFGRFPHRNAILGRVASQAESDFLAQPGSSF